jgi:hypothetical protein
VHKPAPEPEKPRRRRFKNRDEDWHQGEPLLAKVRPLKPEERPATMRAELYTIDDYVKSTEDDRTASFVRVGGGVTYENMYGRGETLNVDGEANYRSTSVPDNQDESKTRMRLDRASYSEGGNRFSTTHFEVGRFLQTGQPAFGVLDGGEWNYRKASGDSYGFSVGFLARARRRILDRLRPAVRGLLPLGRGPGRAPHRLGRLPEVAARRQRRPRPVRVRRLLPAAVRVDLRRLRRGSTTTPAATIRRAKGSSSRSSTRTRAAAGTAATRCC